MRWRGQSGAGLGGVSLGHVKFEVHIRHPS